MFLRDRQYSDCFAFKHNHHHYYRICSQPRCDTTMTDRIEAAAHIQKFLIERKLPECDSETSKNTVMHDLLQLTTYILRQCKEQRSHHRKKSTTKIADLREEDEKEEDISVLSTNLLKDTSENQQAVGFDRLLSKLLSPTRFSSKSNIHNTATKLPAGIEENNVLEVSAFGTPDRQNFHNSSSPVFPRMVDLSSVDRTDEDDDDDGFDLLQSVDDWTSLKHFVRDGIATKNNQGETSSLVAAMVNNVIAEKRDDDEMTLNSTELPPPVSLSSSSSSSSSSSLLPAQVPLSVSSDDKNDRKEAVTIPYSNYFEQSYEPRDPSGKNKNQQHKPTINTNKMDLRKSWSLAIKKNNPNPDPN